MTDYMVYYTTGDGRIVDAIPMADETHSAEASDEYRIVVIDGETVADRGTTRGSANAQDEVNRIGRGIDFDRRWLATIAYKQRVNTAIAAAKAR
jgi:hypothetical protein